MGPSWVTISMFAGPYKFYPQCIPPKKEWFLYWFLLPHWPAQLNFETFEKYKIFLSKTWISPVCLPVQCGYFCQKSTPLLPVFLQKWARLKNYAHWTWTWAICMLGFYGCIQCPGSQCDRTTLEEVLILTMDMCPEQYGHGLLFRMQGNAKPVLQYCPRAILQYCPRAVLVSHLH